MNPIILLVIFTAFLNTAAQLLLKAGMARIGPFSFAVHTMGAIILKISTSPFIIVGLCIYVISVSLWLLVLSRLPVSIAYPMTSLAYIMNVLGAYFIFGESITIIQITGIAVIIIGVYLIAQS